MKAHSRSSILMALAAAVAMAGSLACGGSTAPAPPPAPAPAPAPAVTARAPPAVAEVPAAPAEVLPPEAIAEAEKIFATRCVLCHGAAGKGDGPAAATLSPKPRDYGDKAWQQTVQDSEIEKAILAGGPAVGKSNLMPPNPDLAGKPDVIKALRAKVRGFAGP